MNISSLAFEPTLFSAANLSPSSACRRPFSGRHPPLIVCSSAKTVAAVSSSVSVPESGRKDGLKRIGELSQVSGVLGCQWGDEGKGKLVDILAQHFEIVARCQVFFKISFLYFFFLWMIVKCLGFCCIFFFIACY